MFHPKSFGKKPIKASEPLPKKLQYDCCLQKNRLEEYYLCILTQLKMKSENQAPHFVQSTTTTTTNTMSTPSSSSSSSFHHHWMDGLLSLDPRVRSFMSGYSPSGLGYEWAKQDIGRIYRLCHTMDKLQSRWSGKKVKHWKRYSFEESSQKDLKEDQELGG